MLFLSRLMLDTRHRTVQRDLGNVHQLHRTVLRAFPQAPEGVQAREHFGLLYRVEPVDHTPGLIRLLVQSNTQPDWSTLPARYLGPAPDERGNPAIRSVEVEYTRIHNGDHLIFRLRANPTKRLSNRTPGREDTLLGKRVALLREDDQLEWLARKGEQHGFRLLTTNIDPTVPSVQVSVQAAERGRRPDPQRERPHPLTFGAVLFNGHLEVTNADQFRSALADGIGSGKAFGFGLLSIASRE